MLIIAPPFIRTIAWYAIDEYWVGIRSILLYHRIGVYAVYSLWFYSRHI